MRTVQVVRVALGVLWVVLAGTWLALGYVLAAGLSGVHPVSRPHAAPALQMAGYALWPFGVALRAAPDDEDSADVRGRTTWLVLAGWWLVVLHVLTSLLLALTVIGLPLALLDASLLSAAARPRGLRLEVWPSPVSRERVEVRPAQVRRPAATQHPVSV